MREKGLIAWSDASEGKRGQAGHIIMRVNGPIAYSSRKIKVITSGSTDAESVSGVACTKDLKFVRHVIAFISESPRMPTPLLIDNSGMWFNIRNEVASRGNRHWDSWQHYTREAYLVMLLSAHKIDGDDEVADILTKALARSNENFDRFCRYIYNE